MLRVINSLYKHGEEGRRNRGERGEKGGCCSFSLAKKLNEPSSAAGDEQDGKPFLATATQYKNKREKKLYNKNPVRRFIYHVRYAYFFVACRVHTPKPKEIPTDDAHERAKDGTHVVDGSLSSSSLIPFIHLYSITPASGSGYRPARRRPRPSRAGRRP